MSEIGDECLRRLWLKYHKGFVETFTAEQKRRFEIGHYLERKVVVDFKAAGYHVSGRQLSFKDFKGKFKGHCDGIVTGLKESTQPHILEVKSAGPEVVKRYLKHGIESNLKYHAQVHLYMYYAGLDRALFVLEDRASCKRYQERVKIDKPFVERLRVKARLLIESPDHAPSGISDRPDWWQCKGCALNNADWCRKKW